MIQVIQVIKEVMCLLFMIGAVWQDAKTRKIKNWYNLLGLGAGFLMGVLDSNQGFKNTLIGVGAACLIGMTGYLLGIFRAGDAKLLWAIGAWKGWIHFFNSFILGILAGGVCSVCILLVKRDGKKRLKRMGTYMKYLWMSHSYTPYEPESSKEFPFAIPLAIGVVLDKVIFLF